MQNSNRFQKKWHPSDETKLSAIIFCSQPQINGARFLKYHNIDESRVSSFLLFAAKFPGAEYINFYHKRRPQESKGRFKERIYLK